MKHEKLDELLRLKSTGEITPEESVELEDLIRTDEEACRQYLDYTSVDAMLKWQFDETTVPVMPKKPKVITFGRVLMAAAALLVLGLGIHFWQLIEPNGPKAEEFPVLVESKYGKAHTLSGWSFLPALDAEYEVLGPARVRLSRGEVYAASTPYPQGQRPHLEIETPAGKVTAKGTRFYVSTSKKEKEEEMKITRVLVMTGIVGLSNIFGSAEAQEGGQLLATSKTAPQTLMQDGNYREALDVYEKLVVDPAHTGEAAARDLHAARVCMQKLGRIDFWDKLAEKSVVAHPKDWRVLWEVAMGYYGSGSWGHMVDGSYQRGDRIRGSRRVNAYERDRIRSLQLMQQAVPLIGKDDDPKRVAGFYQDYANVLRSGGAAWRLQMLTDIGHLPAHDDPAPFGRTAHAPVDEDNNPVWYAIPPTWEAAKNDGERWRWLMQKKDDVDPAGALNTNLEFAGFLRHQFGVQTMGSLLKRNEDDQPDGGLYDVRSLKDAETLARLATGVQRLTLPDDFNFIARYRAVADVKAPKKPSPISDLKYAYYEGDWNELPDFRKLEPKSHGVVKDGRFDIGLASRKDYFGLVFQGTLAVPEDGEYTFSINSDDGSAIWVGPDFVLKYDGLHGMEGPRSGSVKLKKGDVPIRVEFFEKTGDEGLAVTWARKGEAEERLSIDRHITPQERALGELAAVYESRRQYPQAARVWKENIDRFGPGEKDFKKKRLSLIVDDWGRLEKQGILAAGRKARCEFTFRNAKEVHFTAHRVKLDLYLKEVKAHLISEPDKLEQDLLSFDGIGSRLVYKNDQRLLGEKVAEWHLKLKPKAGHRDRSVNVKTPLEEAGLYLLEARVGTGNTTRVLVWLTKAVLVQRPVHNSELYFLADAITGQPIPNANLEFTGYDNVYDHKTESHHYRAENFLETTDASGMVIPRQEGFKTRYRWLVTATDSEGLLLAAHGFYTNVLQEYESPSYQPSKAYLITDRPVYRPGQDVEISSWVRQARYDLDDISRFAGREFFLRLNGPRGRQRTDAFRMPGRFNGRASDFLFEKSFKADTYGDFQFKWGLPEDAELGRYQLQVIAKNFRDPATGKIHEEYGLGALEFQVEEYKKPEYEVTVDAPAEPATLGDPIEATIRAKYYFGAPVANAKVKFTVRRTTHHDAWIPPRPWDWFYGPGYGWLAEDAAWYPGFERWGCRRPGWFRPGRPEVIQESTVKIGADGTVKVKIDTAVAKALHGDIDHRYEITAEVVDESRRTIVGKGSVIAARNPFKVYTWLDRGHYAVGDVMKASFQARSPDGKPVSGKGKVVLYKITYDKAGDPVEEKAGSWDVDPDAEGRAELDIKAHGAGQYRLSCTLVSERGFEREGAVLVAVRGKGFDGTGFRFNDLELTMDQAEYAPGDRVKLMVSTARKNSTVALFVRPVGYAYPKPHMLRLKGKSQVYEFDIVKGDMPNIFVEAFTVSDGKVYAVKRQITVPPEKRILDVAVEPSKERYKPGENGTVKVRLTDADGKPFTGSAVVTVYDKSLEYISSAQPGDIKAYFWKWQRQHYTLGSNSINRTIPKFGQLLKKDEPGMGNIGVYGGDPYATYGYASGLLRSPSQASFRGFSSRASLNAKGPIRSLESGFLSGSADRLAYTKYGFSKQNDSMTLEKASDRSRSGGGGGEAAPEFAVRSEFADTAFWKAGIKTDVNGEAEIDFPMPDNLTTWKVKVWALGHGTRVGQGETEVITSKDLLVRLQAPRFFVEKDEVVLSANVHNYLAGERDVEVSLELDGKSLSVKKKKALTQSVVVGAGEDQRVDWKIDVAREGEVTVRVIAKTTDDADAMEMSFPVYVHGALRTESWSGVLRPGEKKGVITLEVPKERRPEQSNLEIRYSPSIALAMVDALPYLANYPHKNCESVINRFVPAVLTQKILKDLGVDLESIAKKATNLNPQEIGDAGERAKQRNGRNRNPIFEGDKVDRMVKTGLADLTKMQNADGGWSWTPGGDSDTYMTALVVSNLKLASDNGLTLVPKMLERGIKFLEAHQKGQVERIRNAPAREKPYKLSADNLDAFVFEVLARTGKVNKEMQEYLYRDRLKLSRYSQALLALGLDYARADEQRNMVVRNLSQFLVRDEENQTAYLDLPQNRFWWRWYDNEIETQAAYLKLLVSLDPKGEATSGLAKYLINNRKHATYWNSTRDTAFCLEALADFVRASGEIEPNMTVEVLINGQSKKEIVITPDNLFTFDNLVQLTRESVKTGKHEVVIRRKGTGPLYYNAYLTTFSLEDELKASGLELKVKRNHYRLVPQDHKIQSTGSRGQLVSQRVDHFKRVKLKHGETVKSGDLVEVELVVDSKNDYEYLLFEDYKPAGFEAVELRSGHRWNGLGAYTEYRDEKVTFQVRSLSRGRHTLRYRIRAEVPGSFSALPTQVNGVYAPELKANSDELRLKVESD